MTNDYEKLNENIQDTIKIIENVNVASNEQQNGIEQINDAVNSLDENTQINAKNSVYISDLSKTISQMASELINAASKASFKDIVKKQVCDIDLVYETSRLKNEHVGFKVDNYEKVGTYKDWSVKNSSECNLGKWIKDAEQKNLPFINSNAWKELKISHENTHRFVQEYVSKNARRESNEELRRVSALVETNILTLFDKLNEIKVINCEKKGSLRKDLQS